MTFPTATQLALFAIIMAIIIGLDHLQDKYKAWKADQS